MQDTNFHINRFDWVNWLSAIAKNPHDHDVLTQVDDNICYLSRAEGEQLTEGGSTVQVLSSDRILEITKKIWKDPGMSLLHKKKMLEGVQYIHQQRQERYQNLFWVVRLFAKFFGGVEAELKREDECIQELRKEIHLGKGAPILGRKVVSFEERAQTQLNLLFKQLEELNERKSKWKLERTDAWYESFFNLEKKFYHFKKNLTPKELKDLETTLKDFEKKIQASNEAMPRFKKLIKRFGANSIKDTLQATLQSLCLEKKVKAEEWKRDQTLFQCSPLESRALYAKRLIKADQTQLSLSLVTAIERTWHEIKETDQEAKTYMLEGKRVIFAPLEKEIYLKEGFISKGSYDAAFIYSSYLTLKKAEERGLHVILQPVDAVDEEIAEAEDELDEEGSTGSSSLSENPSIKEEKENEISKPKSVQPDLGTTVIRNTSEKAAQTSEKVAESQPKEAIKAEEKEEVQTAAEYCRSDEDDRQLKADNCLRYGKLPGIWPTHKVVTVDGKVCILQPRGGYFLHTNAKKLVSAVTLEDMALLLQGGHLSKQDQIVFIKMVGHFLTGVKSLHKLGIIHRDLKSANILCSKEGEAAVSDLGTICPAKIIDHHGDPESNQELQSLVGSPHYIAPEYICYHRSPRWIEINQALDIWGIGMILWECLSGQQLLKHPAFQATSLNERVSAMVTLLKISELLNLKKPLYLKAYKEPTDKASLAHLIWLCSRCEPIERPPIDEVIKHYQAWVKITEAKMKTGKVQSILECF